MSCLALFVALSGGAYAAVIIPNNSVGSNQLQTGAVAFKNLASGSVGTRDLANNSVTYTKIAKGQIGHARVSQSQIQWRITRSCTGASAIQSVTDTGSVTCGSTLPTDLSTAGLTEPLTSATAVTALAGESLAAGSSYVVTASPYVQVDGGTAAAQNVLVTCEIVAGSVNETRSVSFALGTGHEQQVNSIPLSITVPAPSSATEAAVACTRSYSGATAPAVQASSGIDALQAAAITTATTPGTSTTAVTITNPTPTSTTPTTITPTTTATTPTTTTTAATTTTG